MAMATAKKLAGERSTTARARRASTPARGRARKAAQPAARDTYHHGNLAQSLAEAAEAVLRDVGLHGFSLRECARRAGVAHSAPAHHFGDVAGLLTEVAARGFDNLTASMQRERGGATGPQALASIGRGYVRYATGDPVIFALLFDRERLSLHSERLQAAGQRAFAELVSAVASARGVEPAQVNEDDLRFAWSGVHGLSNLLMSGAIGPSKPVDEETTTQGTIGRIVHAVVTRGGR